MPWTDFGWEDDPSTDTPLSAGKLEEFGEHVRDVAVVDAAAAVSALRGVSNGVASLGSDGKVPAGQLPPAQSGSVDVATLGPALQVVQQASNGTWPSRPTLGGETITWPLTWASLPGNTTPPPDGAMAALDAYLPVPA